MTRGRRYDKITRQAAVRAVVEEGKGIADVAQHYAAGYMTVHGWIKDEAVCRGKEIVLPAHGNRPPLVFSPAPVTKKDKLQHG